MIVTVTMNPSIDCSVTVEKLHPGEVNRTLASQTEAGGKGVNVSKLLNNLGCENIAVGFAGAENFDEYTRLLELSDVKSEFLTVPGSTRRNIKISDADGVTTDINGIGITAESDDVENLLGLLEKHVSTNDAVVISGSIGGTSIDSVTEIIRRCKKLGAVTVVDTSGEALKAACRAVPYAVKPNIHELRELCGNTVKTTDEIISAARELINTGIHTVAVSLGGEGLIYVTENASYYSPALNVNVKCTVGAGDAVTAALAMGIENGFDDETILRYAAASGTAAVTMPGSTMPYRETIKRFIELIEIKKI